MKPSLGHVLAVLYLLVSLSSSELGAAQRTGGAARRSEVAEGKAGGTLANLEAAALEAEAKQDWEGAAAAYYQASRVARITGQLQKSISYGNKALDMGGKAGNPVIQARAAYVLALAYRQLGQRAKSMEILEKGIEASKQISQPVPKQNIQSSLYVERGMDFLRQGETSKAIESISYSLQLQEAQLTFLRSRRGKSGRPSELLQKTQATIVKSLDRLGTAYRLAGNDGEAIRTYEKGIAIIKENGLKLPAEGKIYQGLGQLYLSHKDFPHALENLRKSLEIAEATHSALVIQQASRQMADLLLQTQKPGEAISFYRKAIESIESTRSALESEEFRSSYFENKRQIYAGMILAQLGSQNPEEAFNYNERARSRVFLDILGSKVQLARGGALLEEERALQAQISALQAKMEGEEDDEDEIGGSPESLRQLSHQGEERE